MLLEALISLIFGAQVTTTPSPVPELMQAQASMQELLSYECGKSIATMVVPEEQVGPVFANEDLVFTGIEASDNSRLLIVTSGEGTYAVPLAKSGVNRISFSIPTRGPNKQTDFYLGFLHDSVTRSRFFDFAEGRPPAGKTEADYTKVVARRSEGLLPNLEYKIHETAEGLLAALTEDRLPRSHILNQKAYNCEHITKKNPALGRSLKRNLDVVEQIVLGPKAKPKPTMVAAISPGSRGPASVSAAGKTKRPN